MHESLSYFFLLFLLSKQAHPASPRRHLPAILVCFSEPIMQRMCFTSFRHDRVVLEAPAKDLKPENLLLAEDGFMKLTDMGLAKFAITSAPLGPFCLWNVESEIWRSWVKPTQRVGLLTTSLLSSLHPRGTPMLPAAQGAGPASPRTDKSVLLRSVRWIGGPLAS